MTGPEVVLAVLLGALHVGIFWNLWQVRRARREQARLEEIRSRLHRVSAAWRALSDDEEG